MTGAFKKIVIERSHYIGVSIANPFSTGSLSFTISDSLIANSETGLGINAGTAASNGVPCTVTVETSSVVNNAFGLTANGSQAVLQVTKSTITGSQIGMSIVNSGSIISGGDNFLYGNGADGAPTSTVGLK